MTTKLSLDVNDAALARMDAMRALRGLTTHGELIRNAFRVYEWIMEESLSGSKMQVIDASGHIISSVDIQKLLG